MSSAEVRQAIDSAVDAASNVPTFNISDYVSLEDVLSNVDSEAVLIQYVVASEFIASIGGENNQGWEESGTVVLHYVVPTGFDSDPTVSAMDALRHQLRGKRLTSQLTIEAVEPFTDFAGNDGMYGGAWHGWSSNMFYVLRNCG